MRDNSRPRSEQFKTVFLLLVMLFVAAPALAEDGYELWLRYQPLDEITANSSRQQVSNIISPEQQSATVQAAVTELKTGLEKLLSRDVPVSERLLEGSIIIGTPANSLLIKDLDLPLEGLGDEGFLVRSLDVAGNKVTVVAARSDRGLLYGAFEVLRRIQAGESPGSINIRERPKIALRLLNHWDNLDRYVERGYAGQSLWNWWHLPDISDPRYIDYARANASIGINGTVLNNVNAKAQVLSPRYLKKVAALAEVFRPWGIRVFLSVRFSSPVELGGLETADPMVPQVREWWNKKAGEIYQHIPDFGGFLVKANSEGQPGPQDYGRTHADGANMLAAALNPHGGVVMWRAFVYAEDNPEDRVKQAYAEFRPLDGQFADTVLVQVKNGPLDFQPREPIHPLFGAMPGTPLMMEFQITQEYLGFSTHLVYLGKLFEEVLRTDTHALGPGSEVARIIDGSLHGQRLTGIAGVANIGSDRNWSGSIFGQANWYAFGRLAWDPHRDSGEIAEEWLKMTFSTDPQFVETAKRIMQRSREAVVNYMTPLGLTHIMGTGHHYGPAPWVDDLARPDWNPFYYHRAAKDGIGFDRTASGSNALGQYAAAYAKPMADLATVPKEYLLWFHRVPWDHPLGNGRTLWEELVRRYDSGVKEVDTMRSEWQSLKDYIDPERFEQISRALDIQAREARWWRNACLAYFHERSGLLYPPGTEPPPETLDHYRSLTFPYAPGN